MALSEVLLLALTLAVIALAAAVGLIWHRGEKEVAPAPPPPPVSTAVRPPPPVSTAVRPPPPVSTAVRPERSAGGPRVPAPAGTWGESKGALTPRALRTNAYGELEE